LFRRSGFSREHQLIVFTNILFRLDGELRCKSRPCDLPFGSASQHKFIPDEFVFACPKKSNQKKRHPNQFAPSGSPHHSPLPTGRPDSPSGLDMTKFDVPVEFSLPKANTSANFMGRNCSPSSSPKTASLVGAIDQGRSIESCRARTASQDDPLAVKMAEGMQSTSARGVFFGLPFLHEQKR